MKYITNAFSLNMLGEIEAETVARIEVRPAPEMRVALFAKTAKSIVGHADIAALISADVGIPVPTNRESVELAPGDELMVAQYRGPRLAEGATELPDGAVISWLWVKLS